MMLLCRLSKALLAFTTIIFLLGFSSPPEILSIEKKQSWNATKHKLEKTTDALGMPIDENIQDTVLFLNLLGIETTASCEGHLDLGLPYPWVDIKVFDSKQEEEERQLAEQRANLFNRQEELIQKFDIEQQRELPADHELYKIGKERVNSKCVCRQSHQAQVAVSLLRHKSLSYKQHISQTQLYNFNISCKQDIT